MTEVNYGLLAVPGMYRAPNRCLWAGLKQITALAHSVCPLHATSCMHFPNLARLKMTLAGPSLVQVARSPASLQHPWRDLLHAAAGMCSVALPDMELPAIYSSLTSAGSKCVILTAAQEGGQEKEGEGEGGLLYFHHR